MLALAAQRHFKRWPCATVSFATTLLCSPDRRIASADWPEQHHKKRTKPSRPGSGTLLGAAAWELTPPHMPGRPMQPGLAHTCSAPAGFVSICIIGVATLNRPSRLNIQELEEDQILQCAYQLWERCAPCFTGKVLPQDVAIVQRCQVFLCAAPPCALTQCSAGLSYRPKDHADVGRHLRWWWCRRRWLP